MRALPFFLMLAPAVALAQSPAADDVVPESADVADEAPVQNLEEGEPAPKEDGSVDHLDDKEQADLLLDEDDPAAKEGELVGARGIDPGWKDSRVAERAPNLWGQTGIKRVTSARANKSGYFDIQLHGRGFYWADFIDPGARDENIFLAGAGTFGVSLFNVVELGVNTAFASNENSAADPQTTFTSGDFSPSMKVDLTAFAEFFGYSLLPIAVGFDTRAYVPPQQDAVGADFSNFSLTTSLLGTLDLYEPYDWPIKAHVNAGYTYQNAHYFIPDGQREQFFLTGTQGHLLALTTSQWWYDQVFGGFGLEFPLPFVTPFAETWIQAPLNVPAGYGADGADYNYLTDIHTILTGGLRFSFRGLFFDLWADFGATGNGGYLTPDVTNLVDGQPYNPLWSVGSAVSYTFSPFVAETQVEVREKRIGPALGQVQGCVVNDKDDQPVLEAYIEYTGTTGPRIVVDDNGCFLSPKVDVGEMVIKARHPDFKPDQLAVVIEQDIITDARIRLTPAPRYGRFKGVVTNEDDQPVDATIEMTPEAGEMFSGQAEGGAFDMEMIPGRFQVIVKAEGYLQTGAAVTIEPLGKTIRNFVLKVVPKRRISVLTKDKIEINTRIPFEYNKARLLRAAEFILDDVVDLILQNPQIGQIRVEGHTDNTGEAKYNQGLSDDRAAAVLEYLVAKGVPEDRLIAEGFGFARPVATNDTEEGRAKNRRVEFVIVEVEPEGDGAEPGEDNAPIPNEAPAP